MSERGIAELERMNASLEARNNELQRELHAERQRRSATPTGEERDLADQRLRESEERYRLIIETTSEGVWLSDAQYTTTFVNQRMAEMLGYTRDEMIGQKIFGFLTEEGREVSKQKFERRNKGFEETYENSYRRKDGTTCWALARTNAILGKNGEFDGTVGLLSNLTEQHKQEAALRESEERVRQSQKMEAIGSLAGGIAHDFNNILSVILGYTSLLIQDFDPHDPIRMDLEEVHKAGVRAAELTRQLLAFSRQQILEPHVLDLNHVITQMQKMLGRMLGEDMVLNLRTSDALGKVHADVSQFEQVLMNLVINARDAMPAGGNVSIETSNVTLDVKDAAEHNAAAGAYAMLAVTDTGTGMDKATLARIFDPFFTTKEMGKGTGLGLSTVYGIVEQSGGHIRVESKLGKGARFEVYLPTTDRELDEQPPPPSATTSYRGNETILLVEDEDAVRNVMRSILRRQGYNVLEAQNGGEAFLICEKTSKIHLLLTDVVMPRMSGGELAELLHARHPDMGVLYVSGYAKDAIVRHGVSDEGRAFLAKPMTAEGLARKVREVLDVTARDREVAKTAPQ